MEGGIKTGRAQFGSRQTYDTFNYPLVNELTLPGGLHFAKMTNVRGNAGLLIEQHITPEFVEWPGADSIAVMRQVPGRRLRLQASAWRE